MTPEQMNEQAYPVPSRAPADGKLSNDDFDNWQRSDGWVEAPWQKPQSGHRTVLGLDCEMVRAQFFVAWMWRLMLVLFNPQCLTEDGSELARVSVVNQKGEPVYDSLVKPKKPILDYLTRYVGQSTPLRSCGS